MKIKHPTSDAMIEGTVLAPGTRLRVNDFYSSTDDTWEPCRPILYGSTVSGTDQLVWVRIPDLMTPDEALGKTKPPMFRDDSGLEFG